MKLYLIRHGQTDWNLQGKIQGSVNIPLNTTGRHQAELMAEAMDERPVKKIFTSTLTRAVETAKAIGTRQGVELYLMDGLREVRYGAWEGLNWEEIAARYPEEFNKWNENPVEAAPPGGETQKEVMCRVIGAAKGILEMTHGTEDVAVVSHGAALAFLMVYFLQGKTPEHEIIVENASISTVSYDPATECFTVEEMNDTSHLEKDS